MRDNVTSDHDDHAITTTVTILDMCATSMVIITNNSLIVCDTAQFSSQFAVSIHFVANYLLCTMYNLYV